MTPWKEEMLWRLFVETYNRLTLEYGDDLIADTDLRRDDLNNQRPKDISQQELTAFLEGYPQRYLRLVDPSHVYEHVRLSRNLKPMEVQASLTKTDAAWELSTIADRSARAFCQHLRSSILLRYEYLARPGNG